MRAERISELPPDEMGDARRSIVTFARDKKKRGKTSLWSSQSVSACERDHGGKRGHLSSHPWFPPLPCRVILTTPGGGLAILREDAWNG